MATTDTAAQKLQDSFDSLSKSVLRVKAERDALLNRENARKLSRVYLEQELVKFIATISVEEQKDFFDPRNSDTWQREFGHFLFSRVREFASND